VKILFLADLHFTLKQYDWAVANSAGCDLIVIGGDLLDLASALDLDTQINVVEKYLTVLRRQAPLAICSGNHDGDSRNAGDESVALWLQETRGAGIHVDGDSFDLGDTRITVCPWWDGPISRAEVDAQLTREAARPHGRWIWIYHAPPTGARTCWTGRRAIGDDYLRAWIERFQPDFVLSGHIHNAPFFEQGSWIDRVGRTWVFNPGRMIGSEPTSLRIDLDAMTAEWRSVSDRLVRDLRLVDG
jgi:Icc-related predicted phosphoesterase